MNLFPALSWIINNDCNLNCIHCYTGSTHNEAHISYHTDEELEIIKDNLSDTKFNYIFISGGEPALDCNIFRYLDVCRKLNPDNIFILSNGLLLDRDYLERFKEAGVTGFSIGYQHYDSDIADKLYKYPGAHRRILENVEVIKELGFLLYFDTIIMRENYLHLEEMLHFAIEKKVDNITFKRYATLGRGKNPHNLILNKEEYHQTILKLLELQKEFTDISIVIHDPLANI